MPYASLARGPLQKTKHQPFRSFAKFQLPKFWLRSMCCLRASTELSPVYNPKIPNSSKRDSRSKYRKLAFCGRFRFELPVTRQVKRAPLARDKHTFVFPYDIVLRHFWGISFDLFCISLERQSHAGRVPDRHQLPFHVNYFATLLCLNPVSVHAVGISGVKTSCAPITLHEV